MDVSRLNKNIRLIRNNHSEGMPSNKKVVLQDKKAVEGRKKVIDKQKSLEKVLRNTQFQYEIRDELGYFVVRVIDKDTDKVVIEIPSKESQKTHEQVKKVLGIIFDQKI